MKKKYIIKPKTAMIIFSLFIAIAMVIFVTVMNHFMVAKIHEKLELQLKQTYKEILRGYSETVCTCLENYFFALDCIDTAPFTNKNSTDNGKLDLLRKT